MNTADSTFHAKRGSHSILAYIRRASALPPPPHSAPPPARSGAAPSTPPFASASQDPLSPHSRRRLSPDRRWAGGSRGVSPAQEREDRSQERLARSHLLPLSPPPLHGVCAIPASAGTREQRPLRWRWNCGSGRGGCAAPLCISRVGAEHSQAGDVSS